MEVGILFRLHIKCLTRIFNVPRGTRLTQLRKFKLQLLSLSSHFKLSLATSPLNSHALVIQRASFVIPGFPFSHAQAMQRV